jgi:hypothetical protein
MATIVRKPVLSAADCGNNLLRAARAGDFDQIQPFMELVRMSSGEVIHEPGENVLAALFPCGQSLVSFVVVMGDGKGVETALIGREGAIGGIVNQGRLPCYSRAIVRFGGLFIRVDIRRLEEAKGKAVALRHLFARYSDCLLAQVFQSAACNAVHSIEQRCARWLLTSLSRTGDKELRLTQEEVAEMLGVGRSYVSRVLRTFKARGILDLRRERIVVHDERKLRAVSCGCDLLVGAHFDTVLTGVYPERESAPAARDAV